MSEARPSFTELLDWSEGRIPEPRRSQIAALVAQDTETAATIEWIDAFRDAARLMPLAVPPTASSARLRQVVDEYVRPWEPGDYSVGTLAFAGGGAGTARGTRGDADTVADDLARDLVFGTEIGRVRLLLRRVEESLDVRVVLDEEAAAALPPDASRLVLTSGQRVRRTGVRVATTEFEAHEVPVDVDHIWLVHPGGTVRLSPPGMPTV